jgi:enterochelin esterase family protein
VPARYRDGTPAPLLVIQDGPGPIDLVSRALDNLTASSDVSRRLPAFIAIAVQNGGDDAQGSERGLEYDTLSDRYARFVQLEVLPAVLANAQIKAAYPSLKFSDDPEGKATYGCSSGGAAAFTMAWFRPDHQPDQADSHLPQRQLRRPARERRGGHPPQLGAGESAHGG